MGIYIRDYKDAQLLEFIDRCMKGGWEDMTIDTVLESYSFRQRMEDYGPNIKFVEKPTSPNERSWLDLNLIETVGAASRESAAELYFPGDSLMLAYGQFLDSMASLDGKLKEIAEYSDYKGAVTVGEIDHEIKADRAFWQRMNAGPGQ